MKEILSCLTKAELISLLDLIQRSLGIQTDEALKELIEEVQKFVPCTNIVAVLGEKDRYRFSYRFTKVLNVNYPLDWAALYLERSYVEIDPVIQYHFGSFETQVWSDTFRRSTTDPVKEFIDHARSFGLAQGVTLGVPFPNHRGGSLFSFAGNAVPDASRHLAVLEYLVPHLHVALTRIAFPPIVANESLSLREREVLEWMKEGKTSWEISHILNISERTVNFHVRNILTKLHASTRGHAIALAMEQGLIGL